MQAYLPQKVTVHSISHPLNTAAQHLLWHETVNYPCNLLTHS